MTTVGQVSSLKPTVTTSTQPLGFLVINGRRYRVTVRNAVLDANQETLSKIYLIAKTQLGTQSPTSSIIIKRHTTQIGSSSLSNDTLLIKHQKSFENDYIQLNSSTKTPVTRDLFNQAKGRSKTCQAVFESLFSTQKAPSAAQPTLSTSPTAVSLPSQPLTATQPKPSSIPSLEGLADHLSPALESASVSFGDSEDDLESSTPRSHRSSVSSSRTSSTAPTDDEEEGEKSATLRPSRPVAPSSDSEEAQPPTESLWSRFRSGVASIFRSKRTSRLSPPEQSEPSIILEEVPPSTSPRSRSSSRSSFRTAQETEVAVGSLLG
jgi:hypothetical protein